MKLLLALAAVFLFCVVGLLLLFAALMPAKRKNPPLVDPVDSAWIAMKQRRAVRLTELKNNRMWLMAINDRTLRTNAAAMFHVQRQSTMRLQRVMEASK